MGRAQRLRRVNGVNIGLVALTVFTALLIGHTALAQRDDPPETEPVVLTDEQDRYALGRHLALLEDPSRELTIDDITSPVFDAQFIPSQVDVPNLGFSDSAFWVRVRLRNESTTIERWMLELGFANIHFVDLYLPLEDRAGFDVIQTGILRPSSSRDILDPRIVFGVTVPRQSERSLYLRFLSGASMTLPLTLSTPDAFLMEAKVKHAFGGFFFGALFALLAYHLFLLVSLRDKSHLYLVILLVSMLVFDANYTGYLAAYLLPNDYFLEYYYLTAAVSYSLMFVSLTLLAHTFLELKKELPKAHWVSMSVVAVWGVLLLMMPFVTYQDYVMFAIPWSLVSMVVVLAAGMLAWRRGFTHSRLVMAVFLGLPATLVVTILVRAGVVASTPYTEQAFRLGMLWMGIGWSLSLADRVNRLKSDVQRNERRLSQILEGLPLGVVVYEKDQRPSYINRRVRDILGNPSRDIEPDLMAGQTLAQTMAYYSFRVTGTDEKYALAEMPIVRALHGESATADDIEAALIDKHVPLEVWASPVRDAHGAVESSIVAFQDITRRKRTEAELAAHRDDLEKLVEQRTEQLSELNDVLNREVEERKLLAETQVRLIQWLSAVNRSHQFLRGSADLPQAYEQLLSAIGQLSNARSAFLGLCTDSNDRISVLSCLRYESSPASVEQVLVTCEPGSPLRAEIERGEITILSADHGSPQLASLEHCLQDEEIASVVLAPILNEHGSIGLLGLGTSRTADTYTADEIALVERIRFDLARISEYAELYDTARSLAAAEERTRLARDLHDSVTQVLFSASLLAEALPQIWRRDPKQAAESLDGLRRLTRGALAEMRSLLLELRPSALVKTTLPDLISQLVEAVTARTGLPFHLQIEQLPNLPEEVHISFYRVAQEALNNAVKHARASRVEIRLSAISLLSSTADPINQGVSLAISDNGVGFPLENAQSGGMGLGIMRERAAAIGAELSIESQPTRGTTVTLNWTDNSGTRHE